jgi:pimeloyl-ACP methyl ester carboxylesterase
MQSHDVRIDVTGGVDLEGELATAATIHLPDRIEGPLTILFGYPGGGYSRGYYDIRRLQGYSQAEHHANRGFAFVACDHLGIGDSSRVDIFDLTFERLAAANHLTATTIVDRLRTGSLIEGLAPLAIEKAVGMGQSMGGCLLAVQQGLHRTFDAIAILGYSCVSPSFPAPDGSRVTFPAPPRGADLRAFGLEALSAVAQRMDLIRYTFHAADEEPELLEADMPSSPGQAPAPWRSGLAPACAASMMGEGVVAAEAAAIDVPVMVGCGEIDVVTDPWAEPSAFRGSRDVAIFVVPGMRHMHNFARTRHALWERIDRFAERTGGG